MERADGLHMLSAAARQTTEGGSDDESEDPDLDGLQEHLESGPERRTPKVSC